MVNIAISPHCWICVFVYRVVDVFPDLLQVLPADKLASSFAETISKIPKRDSDMGEHKLKCLSKLINSPLFSHQGNFTAYNKFSPPSSLQHQPCICYRMYAYISVQASMKCIPLCMYAPMHVCTYACMYLCMYAQLHECVLVYTCTGTFMSRGTCAYMHRCIGAYINRYIHAQAHVFMYTCMHV